MPDKCDLSDALSSVFGRSSIAVANRHPSGPSGNHMELNNEPLKSLTFAALHQTRKCGVAI